MLYAKSKGEESIAQHTYKLIDNMNLLKKEYGKAIVKNKKFEQDRFWKLLEITCLYHDIGKVYTPFQNMILSRLGLPTINTEFDYNSIKHEQLSPAFIPIEKYELTKKEKKVLFQSIYYHHERNGLEIPYELIDEIIEVDLKPRIQQIKEECKVEINELQSDYLSYISANKRINDENELYIEYCLLKGLLHRLDHASSANIDVENIINENIVECVDSFLKRN